MQSSHPISTATEHLSLADRLESLKAGTLGAIASVFVFFAIAILHNSLPRVFPHLLTNSSIQLISSFELGSPLVLLIKLVMIGFSGFLFAVTYRYIVRRDRNSHLKSGAILAFALIRTFGTIDRDLSALTLLPLIQMFLVTTILLIENIAWLAIVQSILETAIYYKAIASFSSAKD